MNLQGVMQGGFSPEMRKQIWDYITNPINEEQREQFKNEMAMRGIVAPNPEYDQNGLRFDIDYLNTIGGAICMFPLEFMAEYVDGVCKSSMDRNDGIMEQDILSDDATDESLVETNATALGNVAYIILHTKDDMAKAKCLDILWRYLNIYLDNLVKSIMEQSKGQPIN